MKKILTLVVLLMTTISFGQQNLPVYDGFNYTVGSTIQSVSVWTGTTATPDDAYITTSSLNYNGLPNSTGNSITISENGFDPQLVITSQTNVGSTIYAGFILKINSILPTITDLTGTHFAGLGASSTSFTSTLWFRKVLPVSPATDITKFNLGINRGTTVGDTQWITTEFNVNDTIYIVLGYTIDTTNSTSKIWINPTTLSTEPTTTLVTNTGTNRTNIDRFYIRQETATKTPSITIDELRIALSWNDVNTNTNVLSTNQNQISGLQVYPNPTKNILNITTDLNSTKNVEIYDMIGKKVLVENTQSQLNVSSLVTGMYIVKITEDGKTSTKRIVIN